MLLIMDSLSACTKITAGQEEERSNGSPGIPLCRICFEGDDSKELINPCECSGSQEWVHFECLKQWIESSGRKKCSVCNSGYQGLKMDMKAASFLQFIQHDVALMNVIVISVLSGFPLLLLFLYSGYTNFKKAQELYDIGVFRSMVCYFFAILNYLFSLSLIILASVASCSLCKSYKIWAQNNQVVKVISFQKPGNQIVKS